MEKLITTDEQLRGLIPNVTETVAGESSFISRLSPFIDSAQAWLEENITGHDELPDADIWKPRAQTVVARLAFADAVPSLDLVLNPNGFGVVSTQETAPASKERVERLIASLRSSVNNDVDLLFKTLARIPRWIKTQPGRYAFRSMIHFPSDVMRWHRSGDVMTTYRKISDLAAAFESSASLHVLGQNLVRLLVKFNPETIDDPSAIDDECLELLPLFRDAENRWLDIHSRDQQVMCPDGHELWHLLEPMVAYVRTLPVICGKYPLPAWSDNPESFKNNIPGAYFF